MRIAIRNSVLAAAVTVCLAAGNVIFAAPSISNSSFENGTIAAFPTYGSIPDWDVTPNVGMNDKGGPFWDNGSVTSGTRCAFIQEPHSITQTVAGFEAGKLYDFKIAVNARASSPIKPQIKVTVGTTVVIAPTRVNSVDALGTAGTGAAFIPMSATFTSPGDGAFPVKIENVEGSGDNTLLLDAVEIVDHVAAAKNWENFR